VHIIERFRACLVPDIIADEQLLWSKDKIPEHLLQRSGTYGSRARCGSFVDGIWLAWYFRNTIVANEMFSVIFHLPDYKAISNAMQHQKSH